MRKKKRKVLLVGEETPVREDFRTMLESWGCIVLAAEDGESALSVFRTDAPEAVVSDMAASKLNGLSLLRLLREADPNAAVVLYSSCPGVSDAVQAIREGALDFLTLPVDWIRFKQLLDKLPAKNGGVEAAPA